MVQQAIEVQCLLVETAGLVHITLTALTRLTGSTGIKKFYQGKRLLRVHPAHR
jgi:hypothetical protein